jgi:hypothetical protein
MYKEHYAFEKPDNENAKIWNYMSFAEFVSLLQKKAVYFSVLSEFEDKFEGSITQVDLEERVSLSEYLNAIFPQSGVNLTAKERKLRRQLRSLVCVSCWHKNEFESVAMWKMYLRNNEGVALQSTFKLLTECLCDYQKDDVYVGMIKYINYKTEKIPDDHFIHPIMHKRLSFECEHELRAVISKIPIDKPETIGLGWRKYHTGIFVKVNLEKLVQSIHVAPTSKRWLIQAAKSVSKKYLSTDFSKRVTMSDLAKDPLF